MRVQPGMLAWLGGLRSRLNSGGHLAGITVHSIPRNDAYAHALTANSQPSGLARPKGCAAQVPADDKHKQAAS